MKKNFLFKGVSVLGATLLLANVVLPGLAYAEPEASSSCAGMVAEENETVVAEIGNCGYASLRAAVAAAVDNDEITLIADDHKSFEHIDSELDNVIDITTSITIDGGGKTVYGDKNFIVGGSDEKPNHGIFVKGGDGVTIENLTLADFASEGERLSTKVSPIKVEDSFDGTFTLSGVTIERFHRHAIDINGGTFAIDGCIIEGSDYNNSPYTTNQDAFQQGIQIKGGNGGTINGTEISVIRNSTAGDWDGIAIVNFGNGAVEITNTTISDSTWGVVNLGGNIILGAGNNFNATVEGQGNTQGSGVLGVADGKHIYISSGLYVGIIDSLSAEDVTGGTFSDESVSEYVADDYFAFADGDNWVVGEARPIETITVAGVIKPVAGNQATTEGISIDTNWGTGITKVDAYWTEEEELVVAEEAPAPETPAPETPEAQALASVMQIATDSEPEESSAEPVKFTGTFVEGSGYVLHIQYSLNNGYTGDNPAINSDAESKELSGDYIVLSYTAEAKPAQSNMSGGGGSRGGGSSNSNTSAKSDEKATDTAKADEQKASEAKADETKSEEVPAEGTVADAAPAPMTEAQAIAKFGQEQIAAYQWARNEGITTMNTVEDARLDQPLTRAELAKMMVVYMAKVAKKSPVVTGTVNYPDVKAEEIGEDLVGYIQLAYQFQIMGVDANGNPIDEFMPNALVTRGEYATVFSRVLFGSLFNQEGEDFYSKHIAALNVAGILTNTDPTIQEMRGWVMLMMYRSSQNLEEIAKVAAEIGATADEIQAGKKAAEILAEEEAKEAQEATTGDVAEAPAAQEQAEATTGDVAEAPAVEETASAEANTGDVAAEPSNN